MASFAEVRKRAATIRSQLTALSRDGWRHARPCDYQPLERELRELDDRIAFERELRERREALHANINRERDRAPQRGGMRLRMLQIGDPDQ